MENENINIDPKLSDVKKTEGLDGLDPNYFNNLASAVSLLEETYYEEDTTKIKEIRQKWDSLVKPLGEDAKTNIKTNEQISDFIDKILETYCSDNLIMKAGEIVGLVNPAKLGHSRGLHPTWCKIYESAFSDASLEQVALMDKKLFYVWSYMLREFEEKLVSNFSQDSTWEILKDRLLDGNNNVLFVMTRSYMVDKGRGVRVTPEVLKKYLSVVKEVIIEKPAVRNDVMGDFYIPDNVRRDLMSDSEGAELLTFLDAAKSEVKLEK